VDDETPLLAGSLLTACFPRGVQAVTQTTFVEQLSLVDGILSELKANHADTVRKLGLNHFVKRIALLNDEYRSAQHTGAPPSVDFSQVRGARQRGQDFLLEVIAMIVGRFPLTTNEHVGARQKYLAPVLEQNEAIGSYLRSRRSVEDVDPETGETDPNAPAVTPPVIAPAPVIEPPMPMD
jgi:hypothetical protein